MIAFDANFIKLTDKDIFSLQWLDTFFSFLFLLVCGR
jgi:hypothetical protein